MAGIREAEADGTETEGIDGDDGFFLPPPGSIRAASVEEQPPLEPFTLDYAFRHVGGRQAAIDLARLASASNPRLLQVVEGWERLTPEQQKDKHRLLEQLCRKADIDPSEFLGICVGIAHKFHLDVSNILTAVTLDDVVMAGISAAKQPRGTKDRELLYQTKGLIQKGGGIAIQVNSGGGAAALPDFKSIAELALQATQKQLPEYVEGELIDDDHN